MLYENHNVSMIAIVWYGYQKIGLSSDLKFCMIWLPKSWFEFRFKVVYDFLNAGSVTMS